MVVRTLLHHTFLVIISAVTSYIALDFYSVASQIALLENKIMEPITDASSLVTLV